MTRSQNDLNTTSTLNALEVYQVLKDVVLVTRSMKKACTRLVT